MLAVVLCCVVLSATLDVAESRYASHTLHLLSARKTVATWEEADAICHSEGATLASPIDAELFKYMKYVIGVNNHTTAFFIGIKASHEYRQPTQFVSREGIPVNEMPDEVLNTIEQLDPIEGDCLCMTQVNIEVVPCLSRLPYFCYKNVTKHSIKAVTYSTTESETYVPMSSSVKTIMNYKTDLIRDTISDFKKDSIMDSITKSTTDTTGDSSWDSSSYSILESSTSSTWDSSRDLLIADTTTKAILDSTTEFITDPTTESITDSTTQAVMDSKTETITESKTDFSAKSVTITDTTGGTEDSTWDSSSYTILESSTKSTWDSSKDLLIADTTTEAITDSTTEAIMDSTTEYTTDSTTETITDSTTEAMTVSTTDIITDSTTEAIMDSTTEFITDSTTETTTTTEAPLNCSSEFRYPIYGGATGKYYKYYPVRRNWADAQAVCQAEDGDLVVINNKEEAVIVTKIMQNSFSFSRVWVGLRRRKDGWHSVHGERMDQIYNAWLPKKSHKSECGVIMKNGKLDDFKCYKEFQYICERQRLCKKVTKR